MGFQSTSRTAFSGSLSIVRNAAYSLLSKYKNNTVVFTDELPRAEQFRLEQESADGARVETPEEIAFIKADVNKVQRALAQLPAPFREVIVLRELNQLNYRDIAEIANIPIGTVMSRLSRARRLLFDLLKESK